MADGRESMQGTAAGRHRNCRRCCRPVSDCAASPLHYHCRHKNHHTLPSLTVIKPHQPSTQPQ